MRGSCMKLVCVLTLAVVVLWACDFRQPGTVVLSAFPHLAVNSAPVELGRTDITVSGDGMDMIERSLPGTTTEVTLEVPAGSGRALEASAYHAVDLVLSYAGSTTVDLASGETVSITIDMTAPILDAFVANATSQANTVWLNNGGGTFTDSGQAMGSSNSFGIALGKLR